MTERDAPLVLTVRQARELAPALGLDRIRRAAKAGEFYAKLDGRRLLIDRDSYVRWVRSQAGAPVH